MKTIVNFCGNCPFFVVEFDDFAIGDSTTYSCNLAKFLGNKEYFLPIQAQDMTTEKELDSLSSPEWCPLKKREHSYEFKNFSNKRLQEIENNNNEIKVLDAFFDNIVDYNDPEVKKKSEQLSDLYNKSTILHSNEDLGFYEDFQSDFNQKIEEIKEQLTTLEEAGYKLQETFSKLSNSDFDEKTL